MLKRIKIFKDNPFIVFWIVFLGIIFAIFLLFNKQFFDPLSPQTNIFLSFESVGDRGNIYLTGKDAKIYLAATTKFGYNLAISPLDLGDAEEIYEHINEEVPIDKKDFFQKALKVGIDEYEVILRNISEETKQKIEKRKKRYGLSGIIIEPFKKRIYPYDTLASHVIGFVSTDNEDNIRGQYGIENVFNDVLSSSNKLTERTLDIVIDEVGGNRDKITTKSGNILLTLDLNVQGELEKQIQNVQKRWNAESVGGIVMNPHTGEIVALGSSPTFNPNEFGKVENFSVFNNPIVENVFEMGSVFKALTVAIGIDSRSIHKNDTYNDLGKLEIDKRIISNYDGKARGPNTTIQEILAKSLNIGAVYVLLETGLGTYKDYIDSLNLRGITRIDLPKEVPGLLDNLETNRTIEYATASYGHGIAVTPISAIRSFATLANGGFLVQPYVTKEIDRPQVGNIITSNIDNKERKRIFNKETTKDVTDLLIKTFDNTLLGSTFNNPHYSVAAKTGTAQLLNSNTGKYYEDKFLHSYFGYFPAHNPEYIIFLFAVDPKGVQYASGSLTTPFNKLTNYIISYYGVTPDR